MCSLGSWSCLGIEISDAIRRKVKGDTGVSSGVEEEEEEVRGEVWLLMWKERERGSNPTRGKVTWKLAKRISRDALS